MNIQWFPGHMAKTRRIIEENLKLVDVVVEILDARIPLSSRNPEIDKIVGNKPRVIVLNKYDLADAKKLKQWNEWFSKQGIQVVAFNALNGSGKKELHLKLKSAAKDRIEKLKEKGRRITTIRCMIVGVPNVGKSAFINCIAGKASAKTGDRPGVTRSQQWIRINPEVQLLDTPGVLWPKFEDPQIGLKLAFTGAVKDEIMDIRELAVNLLTLLKEQYPDNLKNRYKLDDINIEDSQQLLEQIGKKRGFLIAGGDVDLYRTATVILDEFRGGKIGKMTIESP